MASKRDLLQAHQFLAQRVISALVTRDPDPEQPPFRRPGGAAVGSVVLGVLALVAVWVYGLLNPGGNTAWRDRPAVIVAEESGAQYVYLDGVLHPVENHTSALLALGQHAETLSVSSASLAGVPRGPRIGIADAPDALPEPDLLLTGGWSLCSRSRPDGSGSTVDESVLLAGTPAPGGRPLADAAVLAEVPGGGEQYLIAGGYRHPIHRPDTVAVGLALQSEPKTRATRALVDVLPLGQPIAPVALEDVGEPSSAVPTRSDVRVGQLLVVRTSGGREHYLAEATRLRAISPMQYDIQRADPATRKAYEDGEPFGIALSPAAAAEARRTPVERPGPGAAPTKRPRITGGGGLCVTYEPGATVPTLRVDPRLTDVATVATTRNTEHGMPLADHVHVEPGRAVLVEAMPAAGAYAGTLMVVTDQGRAHPLPSREVLDLLGYGDVEPVRLPAGIVARVPLGSSLDPAQALRP
ncbi:type VII secretion protein EccB [Saccharomonospora cyanea]|uniref:Type VII secretion protein EccB, Actinobacterial n=1 Tax=Saccharomonospora cyanea NA-134 TaxID=882082 RepID=H5XNL2_9PSEU|nr:type VII secretion protein EccB [Saccharomonospora cyanea]EHR61073.1 type VII secretion protein EccB, Actinobacterial [Saccharomonospora cyanea NA-134]